MTGLAVAMVNSMNAPKKIALVVLDKDGSLAEEARKYLPESSFRIQGFTDPEEALAFIKKGEPGICLVRTALNNTSSSAFCKLLRADYSKEKLPAILVADPHETFKIKVGYEAGFSDVETFPINWQVMQNRLRYALDTNQLLAKLRDSEEKIYHAQKAAQMGTWEYVPESKTFILSKNSHQVFGIRYGDERVSRDHFLDVFHPEDREEFSNLLNQAVTRHFPFSLVHRIMRFDKSVRFIQQQISIVRNSTTGVKTILGTALDVTDQRLNEFFEMDKNSVLTMIIKNLPIMDVLNEVIRVVERQRPQASTMISLAKDGKLVSTVYSRLPAGFIKAVGRQRICPESGLAAAAYLGETILVNDASSNPLWDNYRSLAQEHGLHACYAAPILSGKGQLLGVISLYYKESVDPAEEDLALLKAVTDLASVAIEKVQLTETLVYQARHDDLTGLANRGALREWLEKSLNAAKRYEEMLALLYIDLDRFKQVNDSLGHVVGDQLLKEVVSRLLRIVRDSDILARMGGDEFVLAASRLDSKEDAIGMGRRILQIFREPYRIQDHELYLDASIGISFFPEDAQDAGKLIRHADTAMYYAKIRGGNRLAEFEPQMKMAVLERLEIENDLRKAIENKEFELFYQPQYELATKRLIGFEALIRWNHPELGRIPPLKFIPLAEETGLIIPIGEWVVHEACAQNARWAKAGYGPFKVSVNVSSVQFADEGFLDILISALNKSGMDSHHLEIELTESLLVKDVKFIANMLSGVKSLGATTAIDDFGTGYSSMSYLHDLPVDCLKIDRSFVINTGDDTFASERKRNLLSKIVEMSHELGLTVIAEGFDNKQQFDYLVKIGCDVGQGFYLGVPMSAPEIEFYCSMYY